MCLYVDDFGDMLTLGSGMRKARVTHTCAECSREIQPGEEYFFQTSIMDNSYFETWKMCAHCRGTITEISNLTGCPEAWYWEAVFEIHDDYGFMADALEHDLPPGGRVTVLRRVVQQRRKWRDQAGELVVVPGDREH